MSGVFCFRVVGSFGCACLLDLSVLAYAFAFVCCSVAFQFPRVCRLHVCFALLSYACLFAIVCLFA